MSCTENLDRMNKLREVTTPRSSAVSTPRGYPILRREDSSSAGDCSSTIDEFSSTEPSPGLVPINSKRYSVRQRAEDVERKIATPRGAPSFNVPPLRLP